LDEPNSYQHTRKRQIRDSRRVTQRLPSNEHQYTGNDEDATKTSKEVTYDLPEQARGWRRHLVLAMFAEATLCQIVGKALLDINGQAAAELVNGEYMPFKVC
jgi:hypothetical protein